MGAYGGQGQLEAKGIAADFFLAEDVVWSIGDFKFKWHQESLTLLVMLNGMPFNKYVLTHSNTEKLAKEFSATMTAEFCYGCLREVSNFRRSLGPEPRDRHL